MNKNTEFKVRITGDSASYTSSVFKATAANDAWGNSVHGVSKGLIAINGPLGGVAGRFEAVRSVLSSGVAGWVGLGAAITGASAILLSSIRTASQYEQSQRTIEQLVRATGSAAGLTADQLMDQADQVALTTLASVQGIREAQGVLLTFKSVQGETFTDAIKLSQDMAAVFGGSAKDKALQLGKALEDPVAGINALKRSGVSFNDTQKEMIRTMVETGNKADAQRMILDALADQVGGASVEQAKSLAGSYDTLTQRWDEFKLSLVESTEADKGARTLLDTLSKGLERISGYINPSEQSEYNELFAERVELLNQLKSLAAGERTGFLSYIVGTESEYYNVQRSLTEVTERMEELQTKKVEAIKKEKAAREAAALAADAEEEARIQARDKKLETARLASEAKEAAALKAKAGRQLIALKKTFADKQELEETAYLERQQAIADIEKAGVIDEAERWQLDTENFENYQKRLTEIQKAELDQRNKDQKDAGASSYIELMNMIGLGAEAERASQETRMEKLQESLDEGKITQQQYQDMEASMKIAHGARLVAIEAQTYSAVGDHVLNALETMGKENSKFYKVLFAAKKAAAVPQIIVDTEMAATSALASIPGPGGIALSSLIRGMGYASAGVVAGTAIAGAFENGGIVPGNSYSGDNLLAAVNSDEMILNRAQQNQLFKVANGQSGGTNSGGNKTLVQVINASSGTKTTTQESTDGLGRQIKQVIIQDLDASEEITQSLARKFRLNEFGS